MTANPQKSKKDKAVIIFRVLIVIIALALFFLLGKRKDNDSGNAEYTAHIDSMRTAKNLEMKQNPQSPFNMDPKAHFENLKYFDPDPAFVFESKLYEYDIKDSILIYGTKGEERRVVKFGFVKFTHDNKEYKMNVYRGTSRKGEEYYSLWFTDKTTNNSTYGVGRYIDFEKNEDKDFIYTIDFNLAYNPYCAYSSQFSCAIPTKEDYLDLAVEAGEKKFHN